eukprot:CAMPEP_0174950770 /NCGR_PEP_ID=MMETSP1355-20121228/94503_1 /TAXON_ID=464990 /ORGANISM="Hemiselmis tepida, Strain CCMP443" /LENGTH=88 /DNA_ID=CAMNT_0016198403 /DNA_START=927 /DNA_END=1193 /DNA_ORIENTATION=+
MANASAAASSPPRQSSDATESRRAARTACVRISARAEAASALVMPRAGSTRTWNAAPRGRARPSAATRSSVSMATHGSLLPPHESKKA